MLPGDAAAPASAADDVPRSVGLPAGASVTLLRLAANGDRLPVLAAVLSLPGPVGPGRGNRPLVPRIRVAPGARGAGPVLLQRGLGRAPHRQAAGAVERLFLLGRIEMRLGLPRQAIERFEAILVRRPGLIAEVEAEACARGQADARKELLDALSAGGGGLADATRERIEGDAVIEALQVEFARELAQHMIEEISNQPDIVIVAVIGAGMKGTPGIAARVFNALGERDINVIAIAQGSSEANISLVVLQTEADEAIRAIHDTFELGNGAD